MKKSRLAQAIRGLLSSTLLTGIFALALFGAGCAGGNEAALPAPSMTVEVTSRPIVILPLGRTGSSDGAEITVHRVRRSNEEAGVSAPEGREWLLVDLTVGNNSAEPVMLQIRFRDRDVVDLERAYPPGVQEALDKPVPAGEAVRGEVAFLAPAGLIGGTILYGPDEYRWALQLGMFPIDE